MNSIISLNDRYFTPAGCLFHWIRYCTIQIGILEILKMIQQNSWWWIVMQFCFHVMTGHSTPSYLYHRHLIWSFPICKHHSLTNKGNDHNDSWVVKYLTTWTDNDFVSMIIDLNSKTHTPHLRILSHVLIWPIGKVDEQQHLKLSNESILLIMLDRWSRFNVYKNHFQRPMTMHSVRHYISPLTCFSKAVTQNFSRYVKALSWL